MEPLQVLEITSNIAVIGVSDNIDKYGYKIYKCLKDHHKNVFGVTPRYEMIDGNQMYPNLSSIDEPIDLVVFVVSPKFGYDYLKECKKLGIQKIWLQPGTYDDDFLKQAEQFNIAYIQNCVLVCLGEK